MEASTVSIDQVRALVSERQRYEDWLGALEAKRAETPVRVYERVQADYRSRRSEVTARLREHVEMLSTLQTELDGRLGVVDAELTELEDARAEAMLRTAVGEFDSERWEQVRRDVETGIAGQTSSRAALVAELDEVRALLSSARSEPAQVAAATSEPIVEQPDEESELLDMSDLEPAPGVGAVDKVDNDVDAAESEEFVVEAVSVEAIAEWESVLDDSAMGVQDDVLPIAEEPRGASGDHQPQPVANEFHEDFVTPTAGRRPEDEKIVTDDTFDDLAFLRSVVDSDSGSDSGAGSANRGTSSVADQQKTLRCTDCGTMNLPTEWYCERCGGELAAF